MTVREPSGDSRIVVMKFGGTSVAEKHGRDAVASRVREAIADGKAPVVVVSAMGRAGSPYSTDTLLSLVESFPSDLREQDMLMSTGELVSAVLLAHELRASGIEAQALSGTQAGIVTDDLHGNASVLEIYPHLLKEVISKGVVPVVAGFQGVSRDGYITTLGRGGSDTTACALGVALDAEAVEIYTDVDGVATADPRACDSAVTLGVIGSDELYQLARHGSRVVHAPAAELALTSHLGLSVRNTFTGDRGTMVVNISDYAPRAVATALSHSEDIVRVSVDLDSIAGSSQNMAAQSRIYRCLADAGISLDMFTPAGNSLLFTVSGSARTSVCEVLDSLGFDYTTQNELSKVTLVGAGMHGVPGVMAKIAECLYAADVNVIQTADSHATISAVIPSDDLEKALRALHDGFELGLEDDRLRSRPHAG